MSKLNDLFEVFKPVISWRLINELKPNPRNARTHSPKQIQQIAVSINEFGFTVPVLIDAESIIIAGHARVEAAKAVQNSILSGFRRAGVGLSVPEFDQVLATFHIPALGQTVLRISALHTV